jgi:hypothetical protein
VYSKIKDATHLFHSLGAEHIRTVGVYANTVFDSDTHATKMLWPAVAGVMGRYVDASVHAVSKEAIHKKIGHVGYSYGSIVIHIPFSSFSVLRKPGLSCTSRPM